MLVKMDTSEGAAGKEVRMFKILRLLKLGKLLRVARIIRILDRYQEELRVFMDAFGGIILSLLVFIFCHIIACMWYYVGSFNIEEDLFTGAPALDGWVSNYFSGDICDDSTDAAIALAQQQTAADAPPPPPPPPPNATASCQESISTQNTRYLTSVYWSMMTISTVGYGDIPVTTNGEKIVATITMLFGALIFAAITGQMASRFMATMGAEQAFNTRMDEVRQYMRERNVPTQQRRSIEGHFQLLWGKAAIYDEAEILSLLPKVLRDPIIHTQYTPIVTHAALFSKLGVMDGGHEVLSLVAQRLSHTVSDIGLVIIREGEYGSDMYFIAEGEVDVYRTQGAADGNPSPVEMITYGSDVRAKLGLRLGRLGQNAYFGEQAVMNRGNGLRRGLRTRSVISRSACSFHTLSKAALDELRAEIPVLNGCVASVETYGVVVDAHQAQLTTDGGGGDGALAAEVRALSTKLDRALGAIAELSHAVKHQQS
jgi:CRP-like cAMP-binding protein